MHTKEGCLGIEASRVYSRSDLADVSAIAGCVSTQDHCGVGIRHVIAWILKDQILKVLNKRNCVGVLDDGGHKILLSCFNS